MKFSKDYLISLIENKIEESLNLEYKSAMALERQPKKTAEISKDISALANSDGGIIIYGIKEDNENRHLPKELDPINRKDYSKEWLEQIINDKIRPRLNNLKIHPITISDEEVIYVIEVEKSNTAHQADDKRYYKRFNFQSVPMHDYEIRDIINRQKYPKIELTFSFDKKSSILSVYAVNIGTVFAQYIKVIFRLPKNVVKNRPEYSLIDHNIVEITASNIVREIVNPFAQVVQYWPSRYEPVLPQAKFKLKQIELSILSIDPESILEWKLFCDNSNPISMSIRIVDILNQ